MSNANLSLVTSEIVSISTEASPLVSFIFSMSTPHRLRATAAEDLDLPPRQELSSTHLSMLNNCGARLRREGVGRITSPGVGADDKRASLCVCPVNGRHAFSTRTNTVGIDKHC